jgi:hypothetical protein
VQRGSPGLGCSPVGQSAGLVGAAPGVVGLRLSQIGLLTDLGGPPFEVPGRLLELFGSASQLLGLLVDGRGGLFRLEAKGSKGRRSQLPRCLHLHVRVIFFGSHLLGNEDPRGCVHEVQLRWELWRLG